jgi:hypothetical protein
LYWLLARSQRLPSPPISTALERATVDVIWVSLVIGIAMFALWVYLVDDAQESREHPNDEKQRRNVAKKRKWGARGYMPAVGRIHDMDPVEGGNLNDCIHPPTRWTSPTWMVGLALTQRDG